MAIQVDLSNIVDAHPIGSIQVPALEPSSASRCAVSGGGYATPSTVISPDLKLAAQMQIEPEGARHFE